MILYSDQILNIELDTSEYLYFALPNAKQDIRSCGMPIIMYRSLSEAVDYLNIQHNGYGEILKIKIENIYTLTKEKLKEKENDYN